MRPASPNPPPPHIERLTRVRALTHLVATLLSVAAGAGVWRLTAPPGPGLDPDAMSYLGAAQSWVADSGLRIPAAPWDATQPTAPLAHFPPGFSLLIGTGVRAGFAPIDAARIVEAGAAMVSVAALTHAVAVTAGVTVAVVCIAVLALTPAMLVVHASVLSEPLLLACIAVTLWVMAVVKHGGRRILLLGALAACAITVRYAGAALVLAAMLDAWRSAATTRGRVRGALLAAALPVLAMLAWTLGRARDPYAEPIRQTALYLAGWDRTITEGWVTVRGWLAPGVESTLAATVVVMIAGALFIALVVERRRVASVIAPEPPGVEASATLRGGSVRIGACYFAVVLASRLLADGEIPLDERLLAPLGLVLTVAAILLVAEWMRAGRPWRVVAVASVGLAWSVGAFARMQSDLGEYRTDGGDLSSMRWRTSALVAYTRTHGEPLYSNEVPALWFHTARAVHEVPTEPDERTIAAFRAKLARENGALVSWEFADADVPRTDRLVQGAGLVAVVHDSTGTVWKVPRPAIERP